MNDSRRRQGPQRRRPPVSRILAGNRQNGAVGSAQRNYERYLALARDATLSGDRIEAENFYQHAEHYFPVMQERVA
jgi:uncharacterized protein DUF4167